MRLASAILLALMVLAYPFSEVFAGNVWLYMFAHANLAHLALNAITLWSFGRAVEKDIGLAQTFTLFMVAAVVGGAAQLLVTPGVAIMGASAGVFGLVAFYVVHYPDRRIGLPLLMFPGWAVLLVLYGVSAICMTAGWAPSIAHAAHVGGMLVGVAWSRR